MWGHTWELKGEVEGRKQDSCENPPSENTGDESKGATSDDQSRRAGRIAETNVEEAGAEQTECWDEREEDQDEDKVGPEGADHVDQAEDSHPQEEEAECIVERRRIETSATSGSLRCSRNSIVGSVVGICAVEWLEGRAERSPERTKGAKDDHGESVANDELRRKR